MDEDKFKILARKYISDHCTVEEARTLFGLIKEGKYDNLLKAEIDYVVWELQEDRSSTKKLPGFERLISRLNDSRKKKYNLNYIWLSNLALGSFLIGLIISGGKLMLET